MAIFDNLKPVYISKRAGAELVDYVEEGIDYQDSNYDVSYHQ